MIKDGKYKLRKDDQEYDAIVSTLMEGQYPCKSERQFVCILGHFPIPLDSWLLEDFVMLPCEAAGQELVKS